MIRELKTKDLFTVISMLKDVIKICGPELANIITVSAKRNDEEVGKIGIQLMTTVLMTCYETVEDKLKAWFADLLGVSIDDYMEMPLNTTPDLIDYLASAQECTSFFMQVWRLYKKMNGLQNQFGKESS